MSDLILTAGLSAGFGILGGIIIGYRLTKQDIDVAKASRDEWQGLFHRECQLHASDNTTHHLERQRLQADLDAAKRANLAAWKEVA